MIILGITASSDKNAPTAPTIGTATDVGTGRAYNNGAITVTFTAPSYSGGSPITSYTVTSNTGGYTATGASSPLTVTGIPSNTSLTFTVTATNAAGFTSPASSASNSATATTVPQAPTIGTATAGDTSATVTFTAGATGGKTVSTYTATSSPGSITGTSATSPITVSGLTNGTAYTFTVTATNANGTSTASSASNSVTPAAATSWVQLGEYVGNSTTGTVTFSGLSGSTYKRYYIVGSVSPSSATYCGTRINGATTGYGQVTLSIFSSSTGFSASGANQTYVIIAGNNINIAANGRASLYAEYMGNPATSNDGIPNGYAQCNHGQSDTNSEIMYTSWGRSAQADISSIEIFIGTGNFTSLTKFSLYGVSA